MLNPARLSFPFMEPLEGIVTLAKIEPNLLLSHKAKPLNMNISTNGESPQFPSNPINVTMPDEMLSEGNLENQDFGGNRGLTNHT